MTNPIFQSSEEKKASLFIDSSAPCKDEKLPSNTSALSAQSSNNQTNLINLNRNTLDETSKLSTSGAFSPQNMSISPLNQELLCTQISIIENAYEQFKQRNSPETFPQAVESLELLNKISKQVWEKASEEEALHLQNCVNKCTQLVQEMNMASPTITKQDVNGIKSFFAPPSERVYIDELTNEKYYQPDHSQVAAYIGKEFISELCYKGFGILRKLKLANPKTGCKQNCDMFYLSKFDEQIYEENLENLGGVKQMFQELFNLHNKGKIQQIVTHQKKACEEANKFICKNIQSWKYDSFKICGTKELLDFGYSMEKAIKSHAIVFFHKKHSK